MTAFCWDRAVWRFGTGLEADLDRAVEGKDSQSKIDNARQRVFDDWLGPSVAKTKKFKDPAKRG